MAQNKNNENILSLDGATVNGALGSSANFKPVWIENSMSYSIQLTFTGTPAGNFKLQGSNDVGQPQAAAESQRSSGVVNWTDVPSTQTTVSAAGSLLYNVEIAGYSWVRVVWTATGAGTTPILTVARAVIKG